MESNNVFRADIGKGIASEDIFDRRSLLFRLYSFLWPFDLELLLLRLRPAFPLLVNVQIAHILY
jgi:hypothetical protein